MDLQESKLYDLDLGVKVTQNVAKYHPHHVTYAPVNFEVAMSNGSGEDSFTRKYIIWPWDIWLWPQGQGHMKCCLVPSTSCDLCAGKIWSCYFQNIMRRGVFKKIHYLTFDLDLGVGSRSHKTSPSTLDLMWPMHRQNLKLLLRKVYEEMHLQENTLFDIWPWPLTVAQYPLHHVIYAPTKFQVAMSNGLGEDTITRNVTDGRTDRQTHRRRTDFGTKLIYPIFLTKKRV